MSDNNAKAELLGREPVHHINDPHECYFFGLTKRELFAALAMQGFCSLSVDNIEAYNLTPANIATLSLAQADALIKELAKGEQGK